MEGLVWKILTEGESVFMITIEPGILQPTTGKLDIAPLVFADDLET
jgi:hypothetical protein